MQIDYHSTVSNLPLVSAGITVWHRASSRKNWWTSASKSSTRCSSRWS